MILGKIVKLNNDPMIDIDDDKEYSILGVQAYGKGVVIKRTVIGRNLRMKKYKVAKKNQLMWCKVDTKNGAFGVTKKEHTGCLASVNMALADIDTNVVVPEFIELLFRNPLFYNYINSKSTGTTNRKYLTPAQVCDELEIPDLSKNEQESFLSKYKKFESSKIHSNIRRNQVFIQKLRQSVLQDAVSGKLVTQNPNDESVLELLNKIRAKRAKIMKERKIRKEKELPAINEEEMPYELPRGWVWARLIDLIDLEKNAIKRGPFGSSLRKDIFVHQGYLVYEQRHAIYGDFNYEKYFVSPEKYEKMIAFKVEPGDLIISCSGSLGKISEIPKNAKKGIINQALLKIRLNNELIRNDFFIYLFNSDIVQTKILEKAQGSAITNMVGVRELKKLVLGLPPLNEQKRIVFKTNQLMKFCDELEERNKENQNNSSILLEAVLKEAFI